MGRVLLMVVMLAQGAVTPGPMATPPGWMPATLKAEALVKEGKPLEAAAIYEAYSQKVPWFPASHYARVDALLVAGQRSQVPAVLAAARRGIPIDAPMRAEAAMFLTSVASKPSVSRADAQLLLDDARSMLDEVLKKAPRSRDALMQKASVLEAYAERVETTAARRKALQAEADTLRQRAFGVR